MPKLTADELMAAAESFGASFSIDPWAGRYSLTMFSPLIREDGSVPSDEARAVFAEVRRRWSELERAATRKYRAERSPT